MKEGAEFLCFCLVRALGAPGEEQGLYPLGTA